MKRFLQMTALAAALTAGAASAQSTFTAPGGATYNFGGIDWASNGSVLTDFQAGATPGTSFNSTFFAYGVNIVNPAGVPLTVPNLTNGDVSGSGFELTVVARFNETFNGGTGPGPTFSITGGTFDIYLDTSPDARTGANANLSDYTNGTLLLSGVVNSGESTFTPTNGGTSGAGNYTLFGTVTSTNSTYLSPSLQGTTAVGTLQLGANQTNYTPPDVSCAEAGLGSAPRGCFAFQADANQRFTIGQVPEPGTLALLGVALTGLGLGVRRRKTAA